MIIWQKDMTFSKRSQQASKQRGSFPDGESSAQPLDRYPNEPEFWNGRGHDPYATFVHCGCNPKAHSPVLDVICVSPCNKQIHIEQVVHGKSESISLTSSVVRGGTAPVGLGERGDWASEGTDNLSTQPQSASRSRIEIHDATHVGVGPFCSFPW